MHLEPLPPSKDEYWDNAQKFEEEAREVRTCAHYFVHKTSSEVECRNCRIGFVLSVGWSVIDGNLTTPEGVVIGLLGSEQA